MLFITALSQSGADTDDSDAWQWLAFYKDKIHEPEAKLHRWSQVEAGQLSELEIIRRQVSTLNEQQPQEYVDSVPPFMPALLGLLLVACRLPWPGMSQRFLSDTYIFLSLHRPQLDHNFEKRMIAKLKEMMFASDLDTVTSREVGVGGTPVSKEVLGPSSFSRPFHR